MPMEKTPFKKLKPRIALFVFLSTLPTIFILVYHVFDGRHESYNQSLHQAEQVMGRIVHAQVELTNRSKKLLVGLASFSAIQQPELSVCARQLEAVTRFSSDYSDISLKDPNGITVCSSQTDLIDDHIDAPLRAALRTQEFVASVETDLVSGELGFKFVYPIGLTSPEQFQGVLVATAQSDVWSRELVWLSLPENTVAFVADAKERIVANFPYDASIIGSTVDEGRGTISNLPLFTRQEGQVFLGSDGLARTFVSQHIGSAHDPDSPTLYVGIPVSMTLSGIAFDKLEGAFVLLLLATLFFVFAMLGVRRSILDPIGRLLDATKKLEQGELQLAENAQGASELVELHNSFLRMARARLDSERTLEQTRQQLIASQYHINSHIENTPLGYVSWDKNFICTGWNKTCETLFGYTAEESIGKHGMELIVPPMIRSDLDAVFAQLLNQHGGTHNINENITKDGRLLVCDWYNTPIKDSAGNVVGVSSFMQDITEKIRAEEESKRTKDLLEYSQSAAKVGGWELDIATNELYWTAETYRLHDTTPEEFNPAEKMNAEYYLPEYQPILSKAFKDAVTVGKGYELELELFTTKGRLISVYTTCTVTMKEGVPAKLTGIFQDITDQKAAKNSLQREQSRMESILATAADGIVLIDASGQILSFNRAAEQMFGWSTSQVLGKNLSMLMPEPYQSEHDNYLASYVETREAKIIGKGREVAGLRANGTQFPLHLSVSEWFDGEEQLFTGLVRDITKQKEIQAQLIQTQKMDSLTQLSGGLAHDFNNLLAIIIGNLDFLEESLPADDENLDRVQSALRAADRGADITARMLRFARLKTNYTEVHAPLIVNDLLLEMVEILRRTLGPSFDVELNCDNKPVWVNVDPAEFENVVLNLGLNARDAMPEGGEVSIAVHQEYLESGPVAELEAGNWMHLTFRDSGAGMTPEVQQQIFEPFFTTKSGKGSGLGLAMAYGFVQQAGGHIQVSSEPGGGTVFDLYLPISSLSTAEPISSQIKRLKGGNECILLVDDEIELLKLTESQLLDLGYKVHTASNAEEALAKLRSQQGIDLLITDIVMPGGMLGTELAVVAERSQPSLRILLTSGYTRQVTEDPRYKRFDNLILNKPYRKSDLAQRIREVLEG